MESNQGSKLSFTAPVRHSHDVENLDSDSLLLTPVPQASSTLDQNNQTLTRLVRWLCILNFECCPSQCCLIEYCDVL